MTFSFLATAVYSVPKVRLLSVSSTTLTCSIQLPGVRDAYNIRHHQSGVSACPQTRHSPDLHEDLEEQINKQRRDEVSDLGLLGNERTNLLTKLLRACGFVEMPRSTGCSSNSDRIGTPNTLLRGDVTIYFFFPKEYTSNCIVFQECLLFLSVSLLLPLDDVLPFNPLSELKKA